MDRAEGRGALLAFDDGGPGSAAWVEKKHSFSAAEFVRAEGPKQAQSIRENQRETNPPQSEGTTSQRLSPRRRYIPEGSPQPDSMLLPEKPGEALRGFHLRQFKRGKGRV